MHLALATHNVVAGDGQGRVNYEITRHGLALGHAVTLIADRVAPELVAAGARWLPVHPRLGRVNLLKVAEFTWRADRWLDRSAAQGTRYDAVCANGYTLSRPHAFNCAHFVHGTWLRSPAHTRRLRRGPYGWYQGFYTALNALAERRAYAAARCVIAVSPLVADELGSIGVPPARVVVIENGVDLAEFFPGQESRTALGLPDGVPLALFAGDIRTPRKNLETVLRALLQAPGFHLAVAGDTAQSPYPALARALGVEARVHFLGFRRDVAALMRAADVFALPSRYESFGLVVLEALACGLPVVTAPTVGAAALLTPDCGQVLESPEDAAGLAAALQRLTVPAQRATARARAPAVAEAHSWERMAAAYWRLFETAAP